MMLYSELYLTSKQLFLINGTLSNIYASSFCLFCIDESLAGYLEVTIAA